MTSLTKSIKGLARITPETLTTTSGRLWAMICYNLFDHGFLRVWWTNLEEIAPGVWRSNQPGPQRMAHYARMGIKSVLILRGRGEKAHYQLEREAAERAGITLHATTIHARKAADPARFKELFRLFETMEGPWLMHCKSGADRAGLASVLYLLWIGRPLAEARKQLSWRYFHLTSTQTGILDVMLDHYEEALREGPKDIETWLAEDYDPARLTAEWKEGRRHGKPWPRD
ncbi:MAG: sulfur transferase domain-containing protein [Pseudomonadota bacterium]